MLTKMDSEQKARGEAIVASLRFDQKQRFIAISGVLLLLLAAVFLLTLFGKNTHRTDAYKTAGGQAAGLRAAISYEAHCKTAPCNKAQTFNFNVYILNQDGQQVSVVRPDKDGNVNMALPEGNYTMLVGKQFGKDKLFPQESLALKTGQELELKLHYE